MDIDNLKCEVSITDMPIFDKLIALLKTIGNNEKVPIEIKNNIIQYLKDIDKQSKAKSIVCPNCGAILIDTLRRNNGTETTTIHLSSKQISINKDKFTLICNCGCKCEVVMNT